MTLRNGKAVARESTAETSAAEVVETAMESMSLAAGSSSGSADMEVDDGVHVAPSVNVSVSNSVSIDHARAQVRNLGTRLNALMTEQAAVEIQMESHPEGGSEEDKIRLAFIDRDADKLAQQ
ncbi:hypothetical protein BGZ97_009404, partial [Linnemannia gamsii]